MLTNAWIADPENPITIRGGEIFSQPGTYKPVIEITTMDNDKTGLLSLSEKKIICFHLFSRRK
jgi:hypothetical protein